MFKKFFSRKLLVVVLSNVFAGVFMTQGIDVDPVLIQETTASVVGAESIAEAGNILLKGAIIAGQAWVTGRYLKGQAMVDAAEKTPVSSASLR